MNLVFVILATFAFVEADDYILFKTFDLSDEPSIANKVNGIQIDDMSGKFAGATWSVKNIDIYSFSASTAYASAESGIFKFEFPGIAVSVDADVKGKWGLLNYESGITLNIKDMKVEQLVTFEISSELKVSMVPVSCEANINSFGMTVNNQSGKNSVFKLFKSLIKQLIREALETKICSALNEELVKFAADDDFLQHVRAFASMPNN